MLKIKQALPSDASLLLALSRRALDAECAANPLLSDLRCGAPEPDFSGLDALIAYEDSQPVGFLAFTGAFEGAFGDCKGVYSPLHGGFFGGSRPERTLSALLDASLARAAAQGATQILLTRYAHETEIQRELVLSGFGARCCDLIRRVKVPKERPLPYAVRRAEKHELPRIAALENALNRHMGACPVYMPKPFYTPESYLREVEEEHLAVYAAFDGDEPVAHLAVHPGGETFLDQNPASRHIGAAYCRPEYRGNGLIDALLDAAQRDLAAQGVPLLGVDCETLNPPAFRCWSKRFAPFTYSFVRRLDERCALHKD